MTEQEEALKRIEEGNGWADVRIDENTPVGLMLNFLNVLNQRLVSVENNISVPVEGGSMTLTEIYKERAKQQILEQDQAVSEHIDGETTAE